MKSINLITWPMAGYLLGGAGLTCLLVAGGLGLGLVLGLGLAALQVYGPRRAAALAGIYVWFFRGVPILVLMFLFHFGLAGWLEDLVWACFSRRLRIPALASAVLVLGLCSGAYQSQIFRGGLQSIQAGQFQAARALGMTRPQAILGIILPQALRLSIPAWSNEYSILLKDSAIAYVIGVSEIMARFKAVASANYQYLVMYVLAGLAYYLLTAAGVRLLLKLYDRVRWPGLAERTDY